MANYLGSVSCVSQNKYVDHNYRHKVKKVSLIVTAFALAILLTVVFKTPSLVSFVPMSSQIRLSLILCGALTVGAVGIAEVAFYIYAVCSAKETVTIIDARDSGMKCDEIRKAIQNIVEKELKNDEGRTSVSSYIKEEYFKGSAVRPGSSSPETILLAKVDNKIVGFIITELGKRRIRADTGYIAHLAVDSTSKRLGVGTKLMLAAMRKTKELGKRYLTLEYIAESQGINEQRCLARKNFYDSFTTKFGIRMEESSVEVDRQLHVRPCYDLEDVDSNVSRELILFEK